MKGALDKAKRDGALAFDSPDIMGRTIDALGAAPESAKKQNRKSLPYERIPELFAELSEIDTSASRALRLLILTGLRSNEVRGCAKSELDLHAGTWLIPDARMKAKRAHKVFLSSAAIDVINNALGEGRGKGESALVFASNKGRPLNNNVFSRLMEQLEFAWAGDDPAAQRSARDFTIHGFRSSFNKFLVEKTRFDDALIDEALAHVTTNAVGEAYRRDARRDAQTRAMMHAWSRYVTGEITLDEINRHIEATVNNEDGGGWP